MFLLHKTNMLCIREPSRIDSELKLLKTEHPEKIKIIKI